MKLNQKLIKSLIKEAIAERIKMIDEAGDTAALEAKIKKVEEDIKDANALKTSLTSMNNLKYYISPEIISDMMSELDESIKELQIKKKDFEDQKKKYNAPKKSPKKVNESINELSATDAGTVVSNDNELIKMLAQAEKYLKDKGSKFSTNVAQIAKALSAGMSKGVNESINELSATDAGTVVSNDNELIKMLAQAEKYLKDKGNNLGNNVAQIAKALSAGMSKGVNESKKTKIVKKKTIKK